MISTVHLGALAACIVLFVPMGMAGLHMSRNKMLFFSCALFITLAVLVHLTPLFPRLLPLSSFHPPPPPHSSYCLSLSHRISFLPNLSSWDWTPPATSPPCSFQKLPPSDASALLNGSSILVAGDSQARLLTLQLLNLLADTPLIENITSDLFKRHSDYRIRLSDHAIDVDFLWAPYEINLTAVAARIAREGRYPDVLVMGSGLWHMLHFTNASEYGHELRELARLAKSLRSRMFWLGIPALVNSMLNTEEKRVRMSGELCGAYLRELVGGGMLRDSGGPFVLLDIERLSRSCGVGCTSDGMHYGDFVYEAAVQVMLNVLLIESQQRG